VWLVVHASGEQLQIAARLRGVAKPRTASVNIESSVAIRLRVTPNNTLFPSNLIHFHHRLPVQLTISDAGFANPSIQGSFIEPLFSSVWTRLGPSGEHPISFGALCLLHAILLRFLPNCT
jgi:hypothetical protein